MLPQLPDRAHNVRHSKHGYFVQRRQHCRHHCSWLHHRLEGTYSLWVRNLCYWPLCECQMSPSHHGTEHLVLRWCSCLETLCKLWEMALTEESGSMGESRTRFILYPCPALSSLFPALLTCTHQESAIVAGTFFYCHGFLVMMNCSLSILEPSKPILP